MCPRMQQWYMTPWTCVWLLEFVVWHINDLVVKCHKDQSVITRQWMGFGITSSMTLQVYGVGKCLSYSPYLYGFLMVCLKLIKWFCVHCSKMGDFNRKKFKKRTQMALSPSSSSLPAIYARHWWLVCSGARPTKHISIEFEIRWKFRTL